MALPAGVPGWRTAERMGGENSGTAPEFFSPTRSDKRRLVAELRPTERDRRFFTSLDCGTNHTGTLSFRALSSAVITELFPRRESTGGGSARQIPCHRDHINCIALTSLQTVRREERK